MVALVATAPLALLLSGCPDADPEGSDDTGGPPDDPMQMLPGHAVQCCYSVNTNLTANGSQLVEVCETGVGQGFGCIDPEQWDANNNGTLEFVGEQEAFCNAKCAWSGQLYTDDFPWNPVPDDLDTWANSSEVYGCWAIPSTKITDTNSCQPVDPEPYGTPAELVPTNDFAGSTTDAGNSVDLEINGQTVAVDATLQSHFALYDCDTSGIDGGTCSFVFTTFDLSLDATVTSGNYTVSAASLSLAQVDEATVQFQPCVRGSCTGTFEMSNTNGNPLGVDLKWTQQHSSTGSVGNAGINLSHEPGALGGVGRVVGTLVLDQASPTEGDLRLQAYGSDSFGGSVAQIDVDLTGVVSRFP